MNQLKGFCRKEQIKNYIRIEDIIRFMIKLLEEECFERTEIYIFLDQSFEMYAPIWLPMPKEYHYDYWKAFERMRYSVNNLIDDELKYNYKKYRNSILSEIFRIYLKRQEKFYNNIFKLV